MQTVYLIDYGTGNLRNVERAFKAVGARVVIGNTPEFISRAKLLVLPGVGAFNDCMASLQSANLVEPIKSYVNSGGMFLGICVGMQILADSSEEYGYCEGLGIIPGRVVKIQSNVVSPMLKVPHISWEKLMIRRESSLLRGLISREFVYYAHSYQFLVAEDGEEIAYSDYGERKICAVVEKKNVFGTQFHPEKSGQTGLHILKNFVELASVS